MLNITHADSYLRGNENPQSGHLAWVEKAQYLAIENTPSDTAEFGLITTWETVESN